MVSVIVLRLILLLLSASLSHSFSTPPAVDRCKKSLHHRSHNNFGLINTATESGYHNNHALYMSSATNHDTKSSRQVEVTSSIIDEFISTVLKSLQDKTFESFTLKGPPSPRKRRSNKSSTNTQEIDAKINKEKEALRGKYKTILGRLVFLQDKKKRRKKKGGKDTSNSETGSLYLQATIKYHLATDIAQNWKIGAVNHDDDEIELDVSEVESGLRGIFTTASGQTGSDDSAVPLSEWGATAFENGEMEIRSGELISSDRIYELQLNGKKASFRPSKKKRKKSKEEDQSQLMSNPAQLSHDRTKNVPLSTSSEFLQKLGVTNSEYKPKVGMASKLRQCQKFVEIVSNLVETSYPQEVSSNGKEEKNIRVIDMGCGRGYLTFSVHSYLSDKYNSPNCVVKTQGIEIRPKLVREINGIAQDLGKGKFENLNFIEGSIGETNDSLFGNTRGQNDRSKDYVDVVIALHACDTATDDALWFAIGRGVDIIVTAPCCQHELRPQIDRHVSKNPSHILADVLRHAIYRERATEQITDSIRAILLEIAGYNVQVFEFIGGEHTAKNSLITATKKVTKGNKKEDSWLEERRRRLVDLAELYGVRRQKLASLMGERISSTPNVKVRSAGGMPPL